jgi:cytochrome c oxidase subunit 4
MTTTARAEDIQKHIRVYLFVFAALAVLTVVTVAVSYLDLAIVPAVIVALVIATIKGSLVACYFMHLISERKLIYWVLGLTAIFLIGLLALPVLTDVSNVYVGG